MNSFNDVKVFLKKLTERYVPPGGCSHGLSLDRRGLLSVTIVHFLHKTEDKLRFAQYLFEPEDFAPDKNGEILLEQLCRIHDEQVKEIERKIDLVGVDAFLEQEGSAVIQPQ
jgi:hypothetical protein